MAMSRREANFALMQQTFGQLQSMAAQFALQKQAQQDRQAEKQRLEMAKQLHDLQISEQKLRLDALKNQAKARDIFSANLQDPNALDEPLSPTGAAQFAAPQGSALAQNAAARANAPTDARELLGMAMAAGQVPAFNEAVQQGFVDTPASVLARDTASRKSNFEMLKQVAELKNLSSTIQVRESKERREQELHPGAIQKADLDVKKARIDINVGQLDMHQKQGVLNFESQLKETATKHANTPFGKRAGLALIAARAGQYDKALELYAPELRDRSLVDLMVDATDPSLPMEARQQAFKAATAYGALTNKEIPTLSVTTTKDGETVVTSGASNAPDKVIARKQLEELQVIRNVKGLLSTYSSIIERNPAAIGLFANFAELSDSLQQQVEAIGIKPGDEEATQKYFDAVRNPALEDKARVYSLGAILGGIGTKLLRGDTGQLSNADMMIGERLMGASTRFFNLETAPKSLARIKEVSTQLDSRVETIIESSELSKKFFGDGGAASKTALQQLGEELGIVPKQPDAPKRARSNLGQSIRKFTDTSQSDVQKEPSPKTPTYENVIKLPMNEANELLRQMPPEDYAAFKNGLTQGQIEQLIKLLTGGK